VNLDDLFSRMRRHLSVSRAFGTAYERDGSMIIPVAMVAGGGGGGEGSAAPRDRATPTSDDDAEPLGEASNSGGGFGGVVVPVGVYVVQGERVRWVPAVNPNLVFVVVIVALRLAAKSRRRRRAH
jgi:uncharacterized spore protein YtfJ